METGTTSGRLESHVAASNGHRGSGKLAPPTFILTGQIGGFGSHYMTTRLADIFLLVSLGILIASFLAYVGRWQLSLASFLMLALWMGSEMVA
jgi:hypothetical protein